MSESKELHVLSNFEIFKGLTSSVLEDIYAHCQKVVFKETDVLIREGQINSTLYIIIKGQVEVILPGQEQSKEYKRPTKVKLSILDEGAFFGEYSLIDSGAASASVVARKPGELIKISKPDLDNILKNNDRIASTVYHNMLQIMIRRLRDVNKEYDDVFVL